MMDRNKKIINGLLILAGVQVLLLIIVNTFSFNSIKSRKVEKALMKGVTEKNISKVKVWDKIDGFTLSREKDGWYVEYEYEEGKSKQLPGDLKKIEAYVETLASLQEGTVIYRGSDASSDQTYGFTESNLRNIEIQVAGKKQPYTLQLGNSGTVKNSTYLRFAGDSKIRQVASDVAQKTDRVYKNWTRREILPGVTLNNVEEVKFSGDCVFLKDSFLVKKVVDGKTETYTVEPAAEGELDSSAVGMMLGKIVTLKADNFKFAGIIPGNNAVAQLDVLCKGGKSYSVKFYPATEENDVGDFIASTTIDDYLYLFHDDTLTGVFKNSSDLVKKAAQ